MTEAPVRTPAGSAKSLQLTPIWEEVVRNQRVPPDIPLLEVFREIRTRLRAGEWEVRQHALRVLTDVLPLAGHQAEEAELQAALICNLGSPAPGVRRAAREALAQLIQQLSNPEKHLLNLLGGCNDENVTLGIILGLPELLKPLITPSNGGYVLSSFCLTSVLTYLVNKVSTPIYHDASVDALAKIRDMSGEMKFQACLEAISPDPKTIQLLTLNLDDSGIDLKLPLPRETSTEELKPDTTWSDFSDSDVTEAIQNSVTTYHNYSLVKRDLSSEEMVSDGSDDTYTMESTDNGKVVLETEIRLSEEKAITMRIMEEDILDVEDGADGRFISADGSLVMSVVPSSDEDARRTPRRVHFGGEVVKLCTPDSDATDVRIEIHNASGHPAEKLIVEKIPKSSQIPLPISPTTTLPQAPADNRPVVPKSTRKVAIETQPPDQDASNVLPIIHVDSFDKEENMSANELSDVTSEKAKTEDIASSMPSNIEHEMSSKNSSNENVGEERPKTANGRNRSSSTSSGSYDESPQDIVAEFSSNVWLWESLGLLNQADMDILKDKDDWKSEMAVLEQLPRNIQSGDVQQRLQAADVEHLQSLLRYLLDYTRPQTAEASVFAAGQIVQLLPNSSIYACLNDLVSGLCRHIGGTTSVSLKMTAANILRLLFARQQPSDILDVLLSQRCLHSPSSKMRENSLLVLLQALMAFPSTTFPPRILLEEVCKSCADPRRRVRHAALEVLAVLSQFLSTKDVLDCASKYGDSRLVSAVSARLTRRSLPSVSADGLVLYALQIPSARRLGHTGPPQGADVDWILSGTGSLSTGSARSRGQLNAAPPARWGADNNIVRKAARENPWTVQKHRTEDALNWSLMSVANGDDGGYGGVETSYLNGVRPLYVKLAAPDESFRSQRYSVHRVADAAPMEASIRVLTPSVLRKRTESNSSPWTEARSRETEITELRRIERVVGRKVTDVPRAVLVPNSAISHASTPPAAVLLPSINSPEKPRAPPTASSYGERNRQDHPPPSAGLQERPRFVEPAPSAQLVNMITTSSQGLSQSLPAVSRPQELFRPTEVLTRPMTAHAKDLADSVSLISDIRPDVQDKVFRTREKNIEQRVSMASAPAAVSTTTSMPARESSSSSSTTADTVIISAPQPEQETKEADPLEVRSISYRNLNESYNQKVKARRNAQKESSKGTSKDAGGPKFPDSLKPFDRPKEGLEMCFSQLEAQQWEVTVQGLTSLVRLVRHHPNLATPHIHNLSVSLAKHIRNLRSQVSRSACVVAGEMFTQMKRTMEPELEEISGALFQRVADTNRFIRSDSNAALDAMVDSMLPQKSVPVILTRGAAHLNAVVRTSSARLLLRLTERLGPEKMLALPKEIRDKMIQTSASLLTEGRLETRSFAKQLFRVWSTQNEFGSIILEAIPANIMRQISKTLASLRA